MDFSYDEMRQTEMELSAKMGYWQGQVIALDFVLSSNLDKKKIIAMKRWANLQYRNLAKLVQGEDHE